ncbi:hypothetical protein VNI00_007569 [Paramarasmius palmivorus]|uniref:Uncharacterized protein n=1 Tax=Paramarasmius palmivorus TaxID=297713 RepID=A0AAW0D530_9AGAR
MADPQTSSDLNPSSYFTGLPKFSAIRWIRSELPFLPFTPSADIHHNHLFRALHLDVDTMSIIEEKEDEVALFTLRSDLKKEWDYHERMLRKVLQKLIRVSELPPSDGFRFWSYPRQYGYQKRYASARKCRRQVLASRDAFSPLVSAIIFYVRSLQHRFRQLGYADDRWWSTVVEDEGINIVWFSTWVEIFVTSADLKSGPSGVGGVLDAREAEKNGLLSYLPVYRAAKIPVYIYWGEDGAYLSERMSSALRTLAPNRIALELARSDSAVGGSTKERVNYPEPVSSVVRYQDGSRIYNSVHDYFAVRLKLRDQIMGIETLEQRVQREDREMHAFEDGWPTKAAKVYVWEEVDGGFTRTLLCRAERSDVWEDFTPNQRRYDSIRNEWDLFKGFSPQEVADDWDEESFGSMLVDDGAVFGADTAEIEDPLQVFEEDVEADEEPGEVIDAILPFLFSEEDTVPRYSESEKTLLDIARNRYGFQDQFDVLNQSELLACRMQWQKVHRMFGFTSADASSVVKDHLTYFAYEFSGANPPLKSPLLDLSSKGPRVPCVRLIEAPEPWYIIADMGASYVVAVSDATTVLEARRRNWPSTSVAVAHLLIEAGLPFHTFRIGTPVSVPRPLRMYSQLGYRSLHYSFTSWDYNAYVCQRNAFLRSGRGRAALMMGGIVARLARSVVDVDEVLCEHVEPEGYLVVGVESKEDVGGLDGCGYWDHALSQDEVNLICGVYDVSTGVTDRSGAPQLSQKSWWPRPHSWALSGLNTGFWSPEAEAWFSKRLESISEERAVPYTHTQWKHNIKFSKETVSLAKNIEKISKEYLRSV